MILKPFKICLLFTTTVLLWGSCRPYYQFIESNDISCLSLVDRDGFTTTVQTKERLQHYAGVDFLTPQAYQKVMCIYHRDACGNVPAFITSYYPNGQISQYLDIVNSRAYGSYQEWHENGRLKLDGQVVGGEGDLTEAAARSWVFEGCCQAWNDVGELQASIQYEMGSLEGESIYYYPNEQIKKRIAFFHNQSEGKAETYSENGVLIECAHYHEGLRDGSTQRFFSSGKLAANEEYNNGRLINACYYDEQGQVVSVIENGEGAQARVEGVVVRQIFQFHYGLPEGEVKIFDNEGRLVNLLHIKDGKKQGEEVVYYVAPSGINAVQPKLSMMWCADKIHGLVKSWYPDGTIESQREMANNVRNGLATAWYRDGGVMLMEEYDHDKLTKGEYFKRGERRAESRIVDGTGTAMLYDAEGNLTQKVHYYHSHILD